MPETLTFTGELQIRKCWCGIRHAVPSELIEHLERQRDRGVAMDGVYCPLGHTWVLGGESRFDRERKARESAEAQQTHLRDQLHAAEVEAELTRVRLIRDRHRFANGVCPCCNRSFENVRRHMETLHPGYDPATVVLPGQTGYTCSCGRSFETPRGLAVHQGHSRRLGWADPSKSKWQRHLTVTT